jgi:hypothetical protein
VTHENTSAFTIGQHSNQGKLLALSKWLQKGDRLRALRIGSGGATLAACDRVDGPEAAVRPTPRPLRRERARTSLSSALWI